MERQEEEKLKEKVVESRKKKGEMTKGEECEMKKKITICNNTKACPLLSGLKCLHECGIVRQEGGLALTLAVSAWVHVSTPSTLLLSAWYVQWRVCGDVAAPWSTS